MLFKERKRQQALTEREAAGENLWTSTLDERARVRLAHALRTVLDLVEKSYPGWLQHPVDAARLHVLSEEGLVTLAGSQDPSRDVAGAIQSADVDLVLSLIEALIEAVDYCSDTSFGRGDGPHRALLLAELINRVFREERFAAEIIDGRVITFESREMHTAVVVPTLSLLAGRKGWDGIEAAYQDALREIADGHPADAVTDAGRALQLTLEVCGASGNALGPLIKSAKSKGLFAPHDTQLLDGIESLLHWVSADRSETGEAHKNGTSAHEDAWLVVHIVGSLILRLASGGPRGS